jgi:hypothetical protein
MSLKNSNYTIGNRIRNLPVCSVVPYPLRHRASLPCVLYILKSSLKTGPKLAKKMLVGTFVNYRLNKQCKLLSCEWDRNNENNGGLRRRIRKRLRKRYINAPSLDAPKFSHRLSAFMSAILLAFAILCRTVRLCLPACVRVHVCVCNDAS